MTYSRHNLLTAVAVASLFFVNTTTYVLARSPEAHPPSPEELEARQNNQEEVFTGHVDAVYDTYIVVDDRMVKKDTRMPHVKAGDIVEMRSNNRTRTLSIVKVSGKGPNNKTNKIHKTDGGKWTNY